MRRFFRPLLMISLVISLASAAAIVSEDLGHADVPVLSFGSDPVLLPGIMEPGASYDFPVEIHNAGVEPARIVGALEYCGGACYSVRDLPQVIPAGGSGAISLHVEARVPGVLEEEVQLFTDRPSQPNLILKLVGTIREAPDHDDPTPAASE